MQSRRSLLSNVLAPAVLTGGLAAFNRAYGGPAAPEFVGIDAWLNTDGPLTMAGLRGKVALIEFGTYTCIFWRRTLPYVNRWHAEYGPQGLQTICVHTPEFSFESNRPYVESAIRALGITYPVAQDNGYQTWRAWSNRAWPSFYLLGRDGQIRLAHEGEGHSREMEDAIRQLLGMTRRGSNDHRMEDVDLSRIGSPEFYFGSLYPTPQDREQSPRQGDATYAFARLSGPKLNEYQLDGRWAREGEALTLLSPSGRVRVRFSAAKLYLVAGAPQSTPVRIRVDGGTESMVEISLPTLYPVLDGERYGEHSLELECATPGLSLFNATFG